jgi:hypothetical protein
VCDLFVPNQCRVFHNEPAIDPSAARTRKEYGMTSKWERRALLAGALAVPFWLAGIILVSTKAKGSEGPKILASYHQHSDGILLGGFPGRSESCSSSGSSGASAATISPPKAEADG